MAKWDLQIQVYLYLLENIVRDVIPKLTLKFEICEKYKMSSMLLIIRMKIFLNTLNLWINDTWMNIVAFNVYF